MADGTPVSVPVSQAKPKKKSKIPTRSKTTKSQNVNQVSLLSEAVSSLNLNTQTSFNVILYDLETTGLGKTDSIGIVEIGALALEYNSSCGWNMIDEFHTFVQPKVRVSKGVPHKLKGGQKKFEDGPKNEFLKFCQRNLKKGSGGVIAAHNGRRYDTRILFFHGFKPPLGVEMADTLDWFKAKWPNLGSYALGNLYKRQFGVPIPAAHNALPDAYAILKLMNAKPILTPAMITSEPWASVVARCTNKK